MEGGRERWMQGTGEGGRREVRREGGRESWWRGVQQHLLHPFELRFCEIFVLLVHVWMPFLCQCSAGGAGEENGRNGGMDGCTNGRQIDNSIEHKQHRTRRIRWRLTTDAKPTNAAK